MILENCKNDRKSNRAPVHNMQNVSAKCNCYPWFNKVLFFCLFLLFCFFLGGYGCAYQIRSELKPTHAMVPRWVFKTQTPGLPSKFPSHFHQGRMQITGWFYYCSHLHDCTWLFREKVQLKAWRSSQSLLKCWRKTSGLAIVSTPNPRLTLLSLPRVCLLVNWQFPYLQVRYVKS